MKKLHDHVLYSLKLIDNFNESKHFSILQQNDLFAIFRQVKNQITKSIFLQIELELEFELKSLYQLY